jgi:hypothetical protein
MRFWWWIEDTRGTPCEQGLFTDYSSHHQVAFFKVTLKLYIVATQTAEPEQVKTARISQHRKARNTVLLTYSHVVVVVWVCVCVCVRVCVCMCVCVKSFCGLEACNFMTAAKWYFSLLHGHNKNCCWQRLRNTIPSIWTHLTVAMDTYNFLTWLCRRSMFSGSYHATDRTCQAGHIEGLLVHSWTVIYAIWQ